MINRDVFRLETKQAVVRHALKILKKLHSTLHIRNITFRKADHLQTRLYKTAPLRECNCDYPEGI